MAPIERIERFEFYERAKLAFAVVMTGETAKYGNIILKKGGNLLPNIGPDGNGDVPEKSVEILLQVGEMLRNDK